MKIDATFLYVQSQLYDYVDFEAWKAVVPVRVVKVMKLALSFSVMDSMR